MLQVSELYLAQQGEGPYLGRPSVFLRLRGCNLTCSWCDSKNTWDKDDPGYQTFRTWPPTFLAEEMYQLGTDGGKVRPPAALVITGGEPLIQQAQLPEMIDRYRELCLKVGATIVVEVETNGTIVPSPDMVRLCHFNVSPKLPSAGNDHVDQDKLHNTAATTTFLKAPSAIFKLVVGTGDELAVALYISWLVEIGDLLQMGVAHILPKVFLMPEARTQAELAVRQSKVMELGAKLGVSVTTRMQIMAYGEERQK